jgi:hypothetical protein
MRTDSNIFNRLKASKQNKTSEAGEFGYLQLQQATGDP